MCVFIVCEIDKKTKQASKYQSKQQYVFMSFLSKKESHYVCLYRL